MITTAYINLWSKRVGAVSWNNDTGIASFEYEPSFLDTELEIAPIKLPISGAKKRIYAFPELKNSTTFKGLPGFLADVLPDKYGTDLINAWLARNGRGSNSMNPVELLCYIGKRGMGALEFDPIAPKGTNTATKIELDSLINIAQDILNGRKDFSTTLTKNEERALNDILKIGSSTGGARAKAIIAYNSTTGEIRSGQTDAPKGFTHWLLKFDGVTEKILGSSDGYGRVEMAYHLMAKDARIKMTECRLLEENGRAHFMTRRFDRENSKGKLHVQSFCALGHYDFKEVNSYSYEQLFELMRSMYLPYSDSEQLFRRMVFNVMSRNCDDHTKNFSFIMDREGTWKLAPAFDICYSYNESSYWVSQHALSVNSKRKDITREDLLSVAKQMNIKKAKNIISEIKAVISDWRKYANQTKVEDELIIAIEKNLILF
jgi:serine/threonine-protein kinase HipA